MKSKVGAFDYEWGMVRLAFNLMPFPQNSCWLWKASGEAEVELAHLNSIGVIDTILSDEIDIFLFGAKIISCSQLRVCWVNERHSPSYGSQSIPCVNITGNSKHATKNADGRVDGNRPTVYTSPDVYVHSSLQLTRG